MLFQHAVSVVHSKVVAAEMLQWSTVFWFTQKLLQYLL